MVLTSLSFPRHYYNLVVLHTATVPTVNAIPGGEGGLSDGTKIVYIAAMIMLPLPSIELPLPLRR